MTCGYTSGKHTCHLVWLFYIKRCKRHPYTSPKLSRWGQLMKRKETFMFRLLGKRGNKSTYKNTVAFSNSHVSLEIRCTATKDEGR